MVLYGWMLDVSAALAGKPGIEQHAWSYPEFVEVIQCALGVTREAAGPLGSQQRCVVFSPGVTHVRLKAAYFSKGISGFFQKEKTAN